MRYLVGDEEELAQAREVVDVADVPDLVEAEVEAREAGEVLEAADAPDEVVVEVEVLEGRAEAGEALDDLDGVLAQADARDLFEAVEAEGRDGGYPRVRDDDFFRVRGFFV